MEAGVKAWLSCDTAPKAAGGHCSASHASKEASAWCGSKTINTS